MHLLFECGQIFLQAVVAFRAEMQVVFAIANEGYQPFIGCFAFAARHVLFEFVE
jgi:hypothetical protein